MFKGYRIPGTRQTSTAGPHSSHVLPAQPGQMQVSLSPNCTAGNITGPGLRHGSRKAETRNSEQPEVM